MNSVTLVGVDTGGTFTDLVVRGADGTLTVRKLPSTPDDPSRSVVAGVAECRADGLIPGEVEVVHGTTVATNALLQRRGVASALITTKGFRDLLAIGRQTRTYLYTFHPEKPQPLLRREECYELDERLDWQGEVLTPLAEAEAIALLDRLVAQGVESVAVCFLFSYLNPAHERLVGRLARERGLVVSLSCEVAPEPREYERASTTVANAFVAPLMARYLRRLQQQLKALDVSRLYVMQSNGGALSAEEAAQRAVATALSGPAGGVVASIAVGVAAGYPNLITFDMGGTSTDVALIVDGNCPVITSGTLGDLPLRTPQLAIHTVGAGGGSLARRDAAGGLRVGPQSAGADPGPVAYGKGDTLTVTDANVLLGRLPADLRLAGRVGLDVERVRSRFEAFAAEFGLTPEASALGILTVANATMARALRHVSVERGHDPAGFALLAFGGAGGLHACALAEALEMRTVLIPRYPGAFSALGLVLADLRREYVQPLPPTRLPGGTEQDGTTDVDKKLSALIADLRERVAGDSVLKSETTGSTEDATSEPFLEQVYLDLRYVGQSFELRVPVTPTGADINEETSLHEAREAFHRLHRQRFGHADSNEPVEVTAVRLLLIGQRATQVTPTRLPEPVEVHTVQPVAHRPVYTETGWQSTPLYHREDLRPGIHLLGPALILQTDATTYLATGWAARVDGQDNLILTGI